MVVLPAVRGGPHRPPPAIEEATCRPAETIRGAPVVISRGGRGRANLRVSVAGAGTAPERGEPDAHPNRTSSSAGPVQRTDAAPAGRVRGDVEPLSERPRFGAVHDLGEAVLPQGSDRSMEEAGPDRAVGF